MQDDAAPYMDRCREMDFDEHAAFIRDSLERRYAPDPDGDRPHTKEEFLDVWRLLRQKTDAIPPDPPPTLSPLEKAYRKRRRTENYLEGLTPGKKESRKVERDLERLEREIERMEESGKYDEPPAPAPETLKQRATRTSSEVFSEIERAFDQPVPVTKYEWEAVPSGENPVDSIGRIFTEWQQQNPHVTYDEDRIEKARSLNPKRAFTGKLGFDGYFIYTFDYTEKMIMECPFYGNAIFVLGSSLEPEQWLQMKKQEIVERPESTRIPHRKGWFERVKGELGAPDGG